MICFILCTFSLTLLSSLGQLDSAIADFSTCLRHRPDTNEAYKFRGNCRFGTGDIVGALLDYELALCFHHPHHHHHCTHAHFPNEESVVNNMAVACLCVGEWELALQMLETLLGTHSVQLNPDISKVVHVNVALTQKIMRFVSMTTATTTTSTGLMTAGGDVGDFSNTSKNNENSGNNNSNNNNSATFERKFHSFLQKKLVQKKHFLVDVVYEKAVETKMVQMMQRTLCDHFNVPSTPPPTPSTSTATATNADGTVGGREDDDSDSDASMNDGTEDSEEEEEDDDADSEEDELGEVQDTDSDSDEGAGL